MIDNILFDNIYLESVHILRQQPRQEGVREMLTGEGVVYKIPYRRALGQVLEQRYLAYKGGVSALLTST